MATIIPNISVLVLLLLCAAASAATATVTPQFLKEKITHLHFYFHDLREGPDATFIKVARLGMTSQFGDVGVFDNVLTEGPDLGTKVVGRGQGLVSNAQLDGQAIMTLLNFVFTEGEYAGSSLAFFGRAEPSSEMFNDRAIIGGTGAFRGARGYSTSRAVKASPGYLIGEFNLYVVHY